MKRALPSLRQAKILVIILLGLLVPFSVYYLLYSASQKDYFVKRDFRQLSVLGSGIEKKVDAIGNAYTRAAKKAASKVNSSQSAAESKEKLKTELVPVADSQSLEPDKIEFNVQGETQSEPTLEVRQESGIQWLFFKFTDKLPGQSSAVAVSARTKLEDFVAPFFRRLGSGEDFDSVFLADVNGQLLYQWAPDEVHLTNFSALLGKNGAKVDFDQLKQNSSVVDVTIAETDYKLFLQPVELSFGKTNDSGNQKIKWAAGGLVRTSHLMSESRAISYTLLIAITFLFILIVLCFPFLKLIFMGPKDALTMADIYFLAFATLVGSAWLTAFLMFTVGYIDLEQKMDVQLENFSKQVGNNFQDELGLAIQQLEQLNRNDTLISQLIASVNDGKSQARGGHEASLVAPTDKRQPDVRSGDSPSGEQHDTGTPQHSIKSASPTKPVDADGCPKDKKCFGLTNVLNFMVLADSPYPYFTTAFWTDKSGQQRIKWTTKSVLPSYLPISDRAYFTNVLAGQTWTYKNDPTRKFFLEPVYSKASGNLQVILAMPMPQPEFSKWVSSLDIRAISLVQTVLPDALGYGYCVVDDEGNVLFHSDDSRNLVENLFRESDNDKALRAAVLAKDKTSLNVQYRGTSYRMYTAPLNNTPWTIITFRDKRLARSAALEFVAYATCFFCAYALVLLVAFILYYVLNREDRSALLWPYRRREANYNLSVAFNFLLAVIFLLGLACGRRWLLIALIMILPAAGLVFHHYNIRRNKDLGSLRTVVARFLSRYVPRNHVYVLTLVSLLMLVSVLPMIAFFTFAYDREMKRLVELGQLDLTRGIEGRALRVRSQLDALFPEAPEKETRLLQRRLTLTRKESDPNRNLDVYDQFFFDTRAVANDKRPGTVAQPGGCLQAFLQWRNNANQREECIGSFFDSALPFQTPIGLSVVGISRPVSNSDTFGLVRRESNRDRLILQTDGVVDGNEQHTALEVSSQSPTLTNGWSMRWRLGIPVILVLLAGTLFVVIGFIGKRLFLLASDEPIWQYSDELNQAALSQNLFLIASRFTRKDEVLNSSGFQVIDLRTIKGPKDWSHLYDEKYSNGGKAGIAINHFEYRLEDPDINARKIKLVEHFLAHNRTIIVASTADMAKYTLKRSSETEPEKNGNDNDSVGATMSDTVNVLRRFCLEDRGNPKAFNSKLKKFRENLPVKYQTRKTLNRINRLLKAVKRECQSRGYLQTLGESLLQRKDFIHMNPDRISWRVQDRCDAYYHALWDTCSREEKLTLVRLATHQLVSSYNPSLPGLLRRGLVFREPFLRPMNHSFSRFVAAQATPENVQNWKGASQLSLWEVLRFPLLIALVVVAGFLFVSQRDLYNSTLAFVSAFAAVMPVVFKFLGMFPGGKGGAIS